MQLTLIIPTIGRAGALEDLLLDIIAQEVSPAETIVVDAMRAMECRDLCSRWNVEKPEFPLRHLQAPAGERGLPASRNHAIRHAQGDVIAFLDDDTRLTSPYFRRLLEPFAHDPSVMGVGGYISNEVVWEASNGFAASPEISGDGWYRFEGWKRPLPARWKWRRRFGLAPLLNPGKWPPAGHGWPVSFWPPGDSWVEVDFIMGGASAWRKEIFGEFRFPSELDGYGHYEDLVFSLQVSHSYRLVLHRGARLEHHHHPHGRPDYRRYGRQVVHHGYSIWRQFRTAKRGSDVLAFWLVEMLNLISRLRSVAGVREAVGRIEGCMFGLIRPITFTQCPTLQKP